VEADLSSVKIACPVLTAVPASISTFLREALMGLVMTSSNSGNTSPEALSVFSTSPLSTLAVVTSARDSVVLKNDLTSKTDRSNNPMQLAMIKMVFLRFLEVTSADISVSMYKVFADCVYKRNAIVRLL